MDGVVHTRRLLVILKDDHLPALLPALPGIAVTTVLQALELAVTAPPALLASAGAWRSVPATWRRRRPRCWLAGSSRSTTSRGCAPCLLYTSDAADDLLCVDLGGRRIIKKKK